MRSGTSFFDWTVFKKTVARFWPLWAVYSAIWFVALPLNGLMYVRLGMDSGQLSLNGYMSTFFRQVTGYAEYEGMVLAVVFGVLSAMAVCSHLYSPKSANFFGALPVRREGLFLTHYLAGLSFTIVPNLAIGLLTVAVEAMGGRVNLPGLLFWLGAVCGECFFFYSLAVFCGMFTGHLLALPIFYAIVNVLVIAMSNLVGTVFRALYFGFAGFADWVSFMVEWFTPVGKLSVSVRGSWHWVSEEARLAGEEQVLGLYGMDVVAVYAVVALLLTGCAFLLYRSRRLESAGDVVSVKAMRPVFKYGVAVCAGLSFGVATAAVTGGGEWLLMAAMMVWGAAGCFAAQMLLDKSFRVLRRWKGPAVVAGVMLALFLVMKFDLTGFERRVPDPAAVEMVELYGLNTAYLGDNADYVHADLASPEHIRLVNILHQTAVDQGAGFAAAPGMRSALVDLTYHLAGGGTMRRNYLVWLDPGEADREGTAAWAVEQFYADREFYWEVYGFRAMEEAMAQGYRLDRVEWTDYDDERAQVDMVCYGGDAEAVLAAVKEDFFANRIGVRHVTNDTSYQEGEDLIFRLYEPGTGNSWGRVRIHLQNGASSTREALERLARQVETG